MRIAVQSQDGQIVCETLSRKNPTPKMADGEAQGVGSEFKPQYHKKKKKKNLTKEPGLLELIFWQGWQKISKGSSWYARR
jgi:hypothetical protein